MHLVLLTTMSMDDMSLEIEALQLGLLKAGIPHQSSFRSLRGKWQKKQPYWKQRCRTNMSMTEAASLVSVY